jgi:hypothetical protein
MATGRKLCIYMGIWLEEMRVRTRTHTQMNLNCWKLLNQESTAYILIDVENGLQKILT